MSMLVKIHYAMHLTTQLNNDSEVDEGICRRLSPTPDKAVAIAKEHAQRYRTWPLISEHSSQSVYVATFSPDNGNTTYQMTYRISPVEEYDDVP